MNVKFVHDEGSGITHLRIDGHAIPFDEEWIDKLADNNAGNAMHFLRTVLPQMSHWTDTHRALFREEDASIVQAARSYRSN